jgi:thiazolylpeptide-type bacteriocin precursor
MPDVYDVAVDSLDIDLDLASLEISDFVDEDRLGDTEVISKVMSASCTTCECCCSCSS